MLPQSVQYRVLSFIDFRKYQVGTGKRWDNTWFVSTTTPGWSEVKCCMKSRFRNVSSGGMGARFMSKTLTPYHYGDEWDDPWKSILLLRSWAIWRARWQGWSTDQECRHHEVCRQMDRLVTDLKTAHATHAIPLRVPLLGSDKAHKQFTQWTPEVIDRVFDIVT